MTEPTTRNIRLRPTVFVLLGIGLFVAALLLRLAGLLNAPLQIDPRQGRMFAPPLPLPAFHLVDHQGNPFTRQNLQGHWTLALIGFTYCPDVCPLGLAIVADFYDKLDASGKKNTPPTFVFLSVDPFRDTPQILADYVPFYRPEFVGLTGTPQEISHLVSGIGLYYAYADPTGKTIYKGVLNRPPSEKYAVVHSAELLFINPEGEMALMLIPPFTASTIASIYHKLL
ncbi:MAG: SCO family protein [Desulfobulbus sp.]|nr:SCO family protein [Desulfobulbus sp.]